MKTLTDKINESLLFPEGFGLDENNILTREYNNLFGMLSNTLLRKIAEVDGKTVYAITGSAIRSFNAEESLGFLRTYVPVSTMIAGHTESLTIAEWVEKHNMDIYDCNGMSVLHDGEELDNYGDYCNLVDTYIKDSDYLIVM